MTKNDARILFLECLSELIDYRRSLRIPVLVFEFHRTAARQREMVAAGKSKVRYSQHQEWLAIDLVVLAPGGEAIWTHHAGDSYEVLGERWEALNDLCRWGGRFGRVEGVVPGKAPRKLGWDPFHFEISREYVER